MHPEPKKQKFSADARVETGIAHDGTVPRSVAFFISLFSGSNRFVSNGYGSLFTVVIHHSFELDPLIPRIPSKWLPSGVSLKRAYIALWSVSHTTKRYKVSAAIAERLFW